MNNLINRLFSILSKSTYYGIQREIEKIKDDLRDKILEKEREITVIQDHFCDYISVYNTAIHDNETLSKKIDTPYPMADPLARYIVIAKNDLAKEVLLNLIKEYNELKNELEQLG